ncbi:MAG: CheR family methyltransferase [Desulfurivibrionaceae bacterium]|jgi:chemotaxis protein methyltransferase CheR
MAFTFFMRDQPTLEHAVDQMIPYASGRSKIKIWDAGCALGQETYTLAMILAERMNRFGFKNVRIDATDHDSANRFGEVVSEAIYHGDELRRTPANLLGKYFEPAAKPGHYRVRDELRSRVRFRYHDLLSLTPAENDYCLVVCKNVLLHFQPKERVEVFRMFHRALAPGGYLTTENTQKLPGEVAGLFTQVVPDAQVYKKTES